MEKKIYNTKEFAQALGISKNHLLKLEREGKVPPAKRIQKGKIKHRYYTVEDLIKYREILKMPPLIKERRVQLFLNFKGGTGKSTLAASYAYALAELGLHVLAIDLDAQEHLTKCLGIYNTQRYSSIYEVLIEDKDINDVIIETQLPTLDIIPGNIRLSVIENRLPRKEMNEFLLKNAIENIKKKEYKIIVIDSIPNITLLNKNAILSADDLLIPVLPDFLSYDALTLLMEELDRIAKLYSIYTNYKLKLNNNTYIIINQYRNNETLALKSKEELEKNYTQYLCKTIIPYDTKIAQATAEGKPIFQYSKNSKGGKKIKKLVEEILNNIREREKKNYENKKNNYNNEN